MKTQRRTLLSLATILTGCVLAAIASAQERVSIRVPVGGGPDELGLAASPNVECLAPSALTFLDDQTILVLDQANFRLSKVALNGAVSVGAQLDRAGSPTDLAMSRSGPLVLYSGSERVDVLDTNLVVTRSLPSSAHVTHSATELDLVTISRTVGLPAAAQNAADFTVTFDGSRRAIFSSDSQQYEITSDDNILTARPLFLNDKQFIALLEQTKSSGSVEVGFARLVRWDRNDSTAKEDAFRPPSDGPCQASRYYAVSPSGMAVFMSVDGNEVEIRQAAFQPIGRQPILSDASQVQEVASADDALMTFLEQINEYDPAKPVAAIPQISRADIVSRAKAAAMHSWKPTEANVKPAHLKNDCPPAREGHIWALPSYLTGASGTVTGVPYRWGGYFKELSTFINRQQQGHPTGDVCTCRSNKLSYCVVQTNPAPTGLDCSGFVSYAWRANNYYTTSRLPTVAKRIKWRELLPGDIVNDAGSHVRLVVDVKNPTSANPEITVIESAVSCGRVCQRTYTKANLMNSGYIPLRRPNLKN
ncbi:hypothetical protein CN159_16005 [Sinorhizobium meliloti]|uniref:hypothetical protein n=1 Tax=Rhizobium meliloti TaxID=382 RepID=UPI00037F2796|nr:hypothetical protein [Sinorhizobium meliloti]MDE4555496.1 C40 family peptidase [Sinorhizobium meliloti]RVK67258.1 hypothetical protein CN159_16005 [Sinorhizobium meliloti]